MNSGVGISLTLEPTRCVAGLREGNIAKGRVIMSVLTGYIPTPVGEAALVAAIDEARRRDTTLVVLNASASEGTGDHNYASDATATALRHQLTATGLSYRLLRSSSTLEPSEEIVTLATELRADLIVIGLRKRTPVGKLLMGSTAQRVLLDAPCPVLAVKATG